MEEEDEEVLRAFAVERRTAQARTKDLRMFEAEEAMALNRPEEEENGLGGGFELLQEENQGYERRFYRGALALRVMGLLHALGIRIWRFKMF